jgi:two-component system nitrate/nitrite response regulator NarL
MQSKPRVLVVDDDYFVRQALTALLTKDPRIEILNATPTPADALDWLEESQLQADIILLDLEFREGDISGLEAIPALREAAPESAILLFSMTRDDDVILEAIQAGADGYLWKNDAATGIASAILRAHEGRFVVTESVARLMFGKVSDLIGQRPAEVLPKEKKYADLTQRMTQVARLFCLDGLSASEIAEELHISENTVRGHIKSAYEILGADNRQAAFLRLIAREDENL